MKVVTEMGNPFLVTNHDLIALDVLTLLEDEVAVSYLKLANPFTIKTSIHG